MEEKKKKIKNLITAAALGQLALFLAIEIYGTFTHVITSRQGDILTAISLLLFWILMDIGEPLALHRFDNIDLEQKTAYVKFLLLDFVGLAGIAYFIYSMGSAGSRGIYGAVVYALTMRFKRENQDIFYYGVQEEEEDETEESMNQLEHHEE